MESLPQVPYYLLYKHDKEIQREIRNSSILEQPKDHFEIKSDKETDEYRPNDFWQEFDWSPVERRNASELLSQNILSDIVENNPAGRGEYLIQKLEGEASTNWDKFYRSHQTHFFKDRHYLEKAFPGDFGAVYGKYGSAASLSELKADSMSCADFTIVEIGCGVGNTVLPLLELDQIINVKCSEPLKRICVWGLDFSQVAIDLLRKDSRFVQAQAQQKRARAEVWDITTTHPRDVSRELESVSDISLLVFCLSAVSPAKMPFAARNVAATLKPGGTLIMRDYGRYDEAQMKLGLSRGKRISENFYVKSDSTRVFYFSTDDLRRLFGIDGAGLEIIDIRYIKRLYRNRANDSERRRVWVQAVFRKPWNVQQKFVK